MSPSGQQARSSVSLETSSETQDHDVACSLWPTLHFREQVFDRDFLRNEMLLDHVIHHGFERRAIGLHAIGPGIAAEYLVNLVDIRGQPRQHIARRAKLTHQVQCMLARRAERVEQALRNEWMLFMHVA